MTRTTIIVAVAAFVSIAVTPSAYAQYGGAYGGGGTDTTSQLLIAGRLPVDPAKQPADATVVRLKLNGKLYTMALDIQAARDDLKSEATYDTTNDLYRAMVTKQLEVVGDASLPDQVAKAVELSRPIELEGYVYHRTTPYFVVQSVRDAH
ncbi:MAG TPA: hypothetical protein VIX59_21505 [Candidatus Binataceae bacterium]